MEKLIPFLTTTKKVSEYRGPITGKTRTALFWSNLESHSHWKQHITGFLPITKEEKAKIELIRIIQDPKNESIIVNKIIKKKLTREEQESIKSNLRPGIIGKLISNSYVEPEGEYVINLSNIRILIKCNHELKTRLDMICDALRHSALGKKKRTKTKRNKK